MSIKISKDDLQRFLITYQGLGDFNRFKGQEGIKSFFKRVGCVQYDPLNVVGRNADLTLQSRIDEYKPDMLHTLLYDDRALVDGWDKQMSIYNTEDWAKLDLVRRSMAESTVRTLKHRKSIEALQYIDQVKEQLKQIGATKPGAIDIGAVIRGTWGHGKVSSVVMDYLFHAGELGIHDKVGTQKVYDFIENLLPSEILEDRAHFTDEESFYDWYVKRRIGSIGLYWDKSGDGWLGQYISKAGIRKPAVKRLASSGEICPVEVESFKEAFYIRNEDIMKLDQIVKASEMDVVSTKSSPKAARFLAPLDNLMWDRKLIEQVYGFVYRWEVYKPVSQREYGYYVLPVIYDNTFIGRFEPEHIKSGTTLTIKNWWWEKGVEPSKEMVEAVKGAFERFRVYLGVESITNDLNTLLNR